MNVTVNYELSKIGQKSAFVAGLIASVQQRVVVDDAENTLEMFVQVEGIDNPAINFVKIDKSGNASIDLFASQYRVDGGIIQGIEVSSYSYYKFDFLITSIGDVWTAISLINNQICDLKLGQSKAQSKMDADREKLKAKDLEHLIAVATRQLTQHVKITNNPDFPTEIRSKIDEHNSAYHTKIDADNYAKLKIAADRLAWIKSNGSTRLKKSVAAGYDSQRLYVTERAAVEFPDAIVDFEGNSDWKSRSLPSEKALDRSIAINESLNEGDTLTQVVWLTTDEDGNELDEEYEVVVIQDYLGKYTLLETV